MAHHGRVLRTTIIDKFLFCCASCSVNESHLLPLWINQYPLRVFRPSRGQAELLLIPSRVSVCTERFSCYYLCQPDSDQSPGCLSGLSITSVLLLQLDHLSILTVFHIYLSLVPYYLQKLGLLWSISLNFIYVFFFIYLSEIWKILLIKLVSDLSSLVNISLVNSGQAL